MNLDRRTFLKLVGAGAGAAAIGATNELVAMADKPIIVTDLKDPKVYAPSAGDSMPLPDGGYATWDGERWVEPKDPVSRTPAVVTLRDAVWLVYPGWEHFRNGEIFCHECFAKVASNEMVIQGWMVRPHHLTTLTCSECKQYLPQHQANQPAFMTTVRYRTMT